MAWKLSIRFVRSVAVWRHSRGGHPARSWTWCSLLELMSAIRGRERLLTGGKDPSRLGGQHHLSTSLRNLHDDQLQGNARIESASVSGPGNAGHGHRPGRLASFV